TNRASTDEWLPASFHKERREKLRSLIPEKSIVFVFTSEHKTMSNDIMYPYHPDPNFYYLTGHREPNSCLIITREMVKFDSVRTNELIYVQSKKETDEIWDGVRLGVEGVKQKLGFVYPRRSETFADLQINLSDFDHVYIVSPETTPDDDPRDRGDLSSMLKHLKLISKRDGVEMNVFGITETLANMRQYKSP